MMDDPVNGFLRTRHTARLWLGPLQIQVWRDGGWLIALNIGRAFSMSISNG